MRRLAALLLATALIARAADAETASGAERAAPPAGSLEEEEVLAAGAVDIRPIAAERLPIDLAMALKFAGAKNLDLLESKERIVEAQARAEEALGPLVPESYGSLLAFGQKTSGQTLGFFTALGRSFDRVSGAGGAQLSTNPIQTVFSALAAHRLVGAAVSDSEEVGQQVLAEAAVRYFGLEEAAARVAIAEQALAASRELARVAESRERLGTGLSVDSEKAKARVAADEVALARASDDFRKASIKLALVLRLDPKVTLFPLDTKIRQRRIVDPGVSVDGLIQQALAARPAVKVEAERVGAAEHSRTAAWAGSLAPSVYTNLQDNTVSGNHQFYAGAVGLRFSFTSLGAAHRAAAELERERIQQERLRQQVAADVILAREDVATTGEQIESARQGVNAAKGALDLSQARFQGGIGLALDVLDSEAELERARVNLVTAIVGHNAAQVRMLAALGGVSAEAILKSGGSGVDEGSTTRDAEGENAMKTVRCGVATTVLAAMSLAACRALVPPAAVSWRESAPVVAPGPIPGVTDVGYLRVETDTDPKQIGDNTVYNIRRPYEVYSPDGKLVRWVENQGARSGEEPESVPLPPGRYVIASMYGTVYRRVQVEARRGAVTQVTEATLASAPAVFPK
jgi:outer membrane protein TolC